jgi:hypothetical protein
VPKADNIIFNGLKQQLHLSHSVKNNGALWKIFYFSGVKKSPRFSPVNEPQKTGARSARVHTRGQNPLVLI